MSDLCPKCGQDVFGCGCYDVAKEVVATSPGRVRTADEYHATYMESIRREHFYILAENRAEDLLGIGWTVADTIN